MVRAAFRQAVIVLFREVKSPAAATHWHTHADFLMQIEKETKAGTQTLQTPVRTAWKDLKSLPMAHRQTPFNPPRAFLPWFHLSSWHIFAIFLDLSRKSLSCRMSQQVLATACYSSFLINHLPSLQDCWKLLESQVRQGNRPYTGPIGNIRGNMSRRSSSIFCSPCCSHSESSKLWLIAWGSTRSRSIRRPRDKANRHPRPWQHPSSDAA